MNSKHTRPIRMPTTELYTTKVTEDEIQGVAALIWTQPEVVDVWLFGSAARGETKSGERGYRSPSDIDFLVIVNSDENSRITIASAIYKDIGRCHILRPVDVIVWTVDQWACRSDHALGRQVTRDGRQIPRMELTQS
jgi:predicted nucleotidyltransferase